MIIKYYKWKHSEQKILKGSCNQFLNLKDCQFYQPFFSLYFNIHNTKNSHKLIDINRRFFMKEIINIIKDQYETSNVFMDCIIEDKKNQNIYTEELFCKCIPILDPLYFMMNNYNNTIYRNPILPSNYSYNTYNKINDMNNTSYIDNLFSYICSELTLQNINPSFPIYYGSIIGIKENLKYDITDEYSDYKEETWFHKNLGKTHTIDMYVSSDEEEDSDISEGDDTSSKCSSNNNDYIARLKNIPCLHFFIEKLEGTLEDILDDINNLNIDIILSCIFQISFALSYLQKHFQFTHNDLHINNVMFKKTDKVFLYYKMNNIYFKVPTHGYIFKIIDFGRSIFNFHNKLFFNDIFNQHGEAGGQYTYPINTLLFTNKNNKTNVPPNYHFELCRLAITIIDVCNIDYNKDYKEKQSFIDFLWNLTIDNKGDSFTNMDDNFNMYIAISKNAINSKPIDIIQNYIFKKYRIKKKHFPKKLFYSL